MDTLQDGLVGQSIIQHQQLVSASQTWHMVTGCLLLKDYGLERFLLVGSHIGTSRGHITFMLVGQVFSYEHSPIIAYLLQHIEQCMNINI